MTIVVMVLTVAMVMVVITLMMMVVVMRMMVVESGGKLKMCFCWTRVPPIAGVLCVQWGQEREVPEKKRRGKVPFGDGGRLGMQLRRRRREAEGGNEEVERALVYGAA